MKKIFILSALLLCTACVSYSEEISCKDFNKAIKKGNVEFIKQNIKNVSDINDESCFLCTAAENKQDEILDILLENKANPDCPKSSISPLYTAVVFDNNYAIEKLLQYGANPNNKTNLPIIFLAVSNDNKFAVQKLLEAGADENATFMKLSAKQTVFYGHKFDLEKVFIDYWNKRFETKSTDIDKALEYLKESKVGNKYYQILTGNNSTKKPFLIWFCDLEKINPEISSKNYLLILHTFRQNVIYIDNRYRNLPEEVLATILAAASINTDGESSVIEELVSCGVMASVWQDFITKNPNLNNNQNEIVTTFNRMIELLNMEKQDVFAKGDYNNFWLLQFALKNYKKTSKGFRNKDLNTYFEYNI